jgi:HPt (histidine-containing phosphotransfer) domain-containing protein
MKNVKFLLELQMNESIETLETSLSHIQNYTSHTNEILKHGEVDLGFEGVPFVVNSKKLNEMIQTEVEFIEDFSSALLEEVLVEEQSNIQKIIEEAKKLAKEYQQAVL